MLLETAVILYSQHLPQGGAVGQFQHRPHHLLSSYCWLQIQCNV